ncbi:MAG: methionine synthase [Jatrophihabitans sp.]|uniref:methionine synthase n=1 Tax=Jatrophihabitans sp. TaxID=1932789 RepID=UPI003911078B
MSRPWPTGAVTGIGSLPGTDPADAAALVFGELPDLPHLPELPERGAGGDMIGRTAALLVDLPVELVPSGWQIAAHPGRDLRRASDLLARDLDALQNAAGGYSGALKLQAAGPLTLAAAVELRTGHKVVSDAGALRDLTESLAEGLAGHLADAAARLPGAPLVLQLDEPSLPAVLAGEIRTPSGYGTVRALDRQVVEQSVRTVLGVAPPGGRVVHSCAAGTPIGLLTAAGADAVGVDASLLGVPDYDALGEAVEAGVALWLGVVPATDSDVTLDRARGPIRRMWSELGFDPELLATTVVATPTCGFAGASPGYVRRALAVLREVGRNSLDPS